MIRVVRQGEKDTSKTKQSHDNEKKPKLIAIAVAPSAKLVELVAKPVAKPQGKVENGLGEIIPG